MTNKVVMQEGMFGCSDQFKGARSKFSPFDAGITTVSNHLINLLTSCWSKTDLSVQSDQQTRNENLLQRP